MEVKNIKGVELLPRHYIELPEPYGNALYAKNHHDGVVYNTGIIWDVDDIELEIINSTILPGTYWDILLSQEDITDSTSIYGIHSGGTQRGICASIAGITLTSSLTRDDYSPTPPDPNGGYYIKFSCKNGTATLTVRRTFSNLTDVKTANYTFVPATQPICLFGTIINNAVTSFCHWDNVIREFKIRKAGVLVLYGVFARQSGQSTVKIFNLVDNTTIDPTTGKMLEYGAELFDSTFSWKRYITSVDLAETSWRDNSMYGAFFQCDSLRTVTNIPNTVTNMTGAFGGTNISSNLHIPNSVTSLEDTFQGCKNMVSAPVIPNSVTNMSYTFSSCNSLTNPPAIPNSVTDMSYTFYQCNSLTVAPVIPNSVTNMCGTFSGCNLVNAPVIPNSVTDMRSTFSDCHNLSTISDIPSSVTNMSSTFSGSSNLVGTMNIHSANVTAAYSCFYIHDTRPSTLTVHVPANSTTYNTFLTAGYDDQGTKDGVILLADL